MPKTSVIIPAHNLESHVRGTLVSVHGWAAGDYEVIDDGSTDATAGIGALCQSRIAGLSGRSLALVRRGQGGAGAARNDAPDRGQGDLLCFGGADDVLHHPASPGECGRSLRHQPAGLHQARLLNLGDRPSDGQYSRFAAGPGQLPAAAGQITGDWKRMRKGRKMMIARAEQSGFGFSGKARNAALARNALVWPNAACKHGDMASAWRLALRFWRHDGAFALTDGRARIRIAGCLASFMPEFVHDWTRSHHKRSQDAADHE